MRDTIRCGVLGAGWWATYAHIPALQEYPGAALVAVQNNRREEVDRIARDFGIPFACASVEELLAVQGLSAVIVSSSPNLHYSNALASLEAGKHVLIEKPMTLKLSEAIHLSRVAEERNLLLLICCPWHYTPHADEARRLVREGALGDIRMISMLMTNPTSGLLRGTDLQPTHGIPYMTPRKGTYSDPAIAGGGQIYAQVCHAAAYLTFLTGAQAQAVFARFHNDGACVDIYDSLSLRMDDASIVSIASTGATTDTRKDFEIRVFGTEGMLFLELWHGHMEFVPMKGTPRSYPALEPDDIYPHLAPARNLIDSIRDPSSNRSPATLGIAAMKVLESAARSFESGRDVLVTSLMEGQV